MQEIAVYDLEGNTLTTLVQYDTDVYIYIKDSRITAAHQVQFFNSISELALVMDSTYDNGVLSVKIPNDLLIQPYTITGYVNVKRNNENRCLYCFRIAVRKKPQPINWVYVDNKDYVTFKQIIAECKEFAENASTSATNAKNSENNAGNSAAAALVSESNAKTSETNAKTSETKSKQSETNAKNSERKAYEDAMVAFNSALLSKSYAIGESGFLTNESWEKILTSSSDYVPIETRVNEDVENAKYYYEQSAILARQAKDSATSAENANNELINLKLDIPTVKQSELNAKDSEKNAKYYYEQSAIQADNSKTSAINAKNSEKQSNTNALLSQSYAVGGATDFLLDNEDNHIITDDEFTLYLSFFREDENTENAKYYYEQVKNIAFDITKKVGDIKYDYEQITNLEIKIGNVLKSYETIISTLNNRVSTLEEFIIKNDMNNITSILDSDGNHIVTDSNDTFIGKMLI